MSHPSAGTLPVTVVIPVRNEEKHLTECLKGLGRFAAVVVVDSGSSDRTPEIARTWGAHWIDFAWNGRFPKKRNWTLINHPPTTPWVLFLDADERVTPEFVEELSRELHCSPHAGYWLRYENRFMGRILCHGLPMKKLALFRVGSGLYERIEDEGWSSLDMEVHEHPVLDGSTGTIRAKLDHHDEKGLRAYIAKHNEYSTWEAERCRALSSSPDKWKQLTGAQRRKYRSIRSWWFAPAFFVYGYVLKRGFLDGTVGFTFAMLKAIYYYQTRLKLIEMEMPTRPGSADSQEQRPAPRRVGGRPLAPPSPPLDKRPSV